MIQQRFNADCAVACLAMFLGVEYEEVAKHCTGWELVRDGMPNFRGKHLASLFKAAIVFLDPAMLDRARPAVLAVPSLNEAGGTHALFWDGTRVFDPNEGREGKFIYDRAEVAWARAIEGYQLEAVPA